MALSINFRRLRDQTNLRQQFGFAACMLCLVIVASVATGAAIVGERAVRVSAEQEMSEISFAVADRLNRGFASRLNTLELLAQMEPIRATLTAGGTAATDLFDQAIRGIPNTAWIAYADSSGIVRSASGGRLIGEDVSGEAWFVNRLAGSKLTDIDAFDRLAPFLQTLPGGGSRQFLGLTARVENDRGRLMGVIVALVDWREWALDTMSVTLSRRDETETTEIRIFDRDGDVLLSSSPKSDPHLGGILPALGNAPRGSSTVEIRDTPTAIGFAHTFGNLGYGWAILSIKPQPLALGMLHSIVATIVIIGTVVGLLGLIGAVLLARRLSRPICDLADVADQLGRDEQAMIPWLRGSSEVVRLSSALRGLVVRLGFSEKQREMVEWRAADEAKKFSDDIAELRTLADTDGLTHLLNRRGFMAFAEDALDHYQRYRRSFAILMLDLDHFKTINDTHGHAAGDTVLGMTAARISEALRPSDKVGRFGGEEFIVLLREVSREEARETAERICRVVAAEPMPFDDSTIPVTISIGLAAVGPMDRDIQDVVGRADQALYEAKNNGRNRVAVAAELIPLRKVG
jgi:diguanylate cyclase (GGDEF)-like protein